VDIGARDEARMNKKAVQIQPADSEPGSAIDIADDPYIKGALHLLDGLAAIRREIDRL
jgi:hypothetical protein